MTLIEILVVVIVIGVLATLGFVNYTGIREHAMNKEAVANLKLIAAAERIFRLETGAYYGPTTAIADINTNLKLYLPTANTREWDYAIRAAAATTFTATASRAQFGNCAYSLTVPNSTDDEPAVASGTCR